MTTFRAWFDQFTKATGETPDAVVFEQNRDAWRLQDWPALPDGVTQFADVAAAVLDCEFSADFGGNESPNFCAWSASWVIFSDNYDGAEGPCWVPRSPVTHDPIRPGGG